MSREVMERPPLAADERVPYGDDPNQFYDVFLPRPEQCRPRGLAIMIHGGFWRSRLNLDYASHLCTALAHEGLMVASLEYRRGADNGGGWPATFRDVGVGFAAIRDRFQNFGHPIVLGHSAGGHLALLLAANTRDIRGVVALGAVCCLEMGHLENLGSGAVEEFMGGPPQKIPEYYAAADPFQHKSSVPRTLVHGTDDDVVPFLLSSRFWKTRRTDTGPVKLVEIPGGDHFDVVDPQSKAWPIVLRSVESMLA